MPNRKQFSSNAEYNAYYRAYRQKHLDKMRQYGREYNRLWRKANGYHNEEKWKFSHPVKLYAEKLVQSAIRKGIVKRLPCALCGKEKSVAHHPNYHKPLMVVFLCHAHHSEIHNASPRKALEIARKKAVDLSYPPKLVDSEKTSVI